MGVAARASGLDRDVHHDHPWGLYRMSNPGLGAPHGDVFARGHVRWIEMRRSAQFVRDQLAALPRGALRVPHGPLAPDHLAVSLVEGFRGEICHVGLTDAAGRFIA